jgi:hypothetical protein
MDELKCENCGKIAQEGDEFFQEGDGPLFCENCYNSLTNQSGGIAEEAVDGFFEGIASGIGSLFRF